MEAVGQAAAAAARGARRGFRGRAGGFGVGDRQRRLADRDAADKAIAITHPHARRPRNRAPIPRRDPPIIGRVQSGRFLLDLRGIFQPEDLVPNSLEPSQKLNR